MHRARQSTGARDKGGHVSEALRCRHATGARRRRPVRLCLLRNAVHLEVRMITFHLVLMILALVCFLLSAVNVASPRVNLLAAGLACWVLSLLVTG